MLWFIPNSTLSRLARLYDQKFKWVYGILEVDINVLNLRWPLVSCDSFEPICSIDFRLWRWTSCATFGTLIENSKKQPPAVPLYVYITCVSPRGKRPKYNKHCRQWHVFPDLVLAKAHANYRSFSTLIWIVYNMKESFQMCVVAWKRWGTRCSRVARF